MINLNKDWKQVPPSLLKKDDCYIYTGYQQYNINNYTINPIDQRLKAKYDILHKHLNFNNKSVLDLGAANLFWSFYANLNNAKNITALEIDNRYIKTNNILLNNIKNKITQVNQKISTYTTPHDIVVAISIIHWITNFSDKINNGTLKDTIDFLLSITKETLIIEWIEPTDPALKILNHIKNVSDWTKFNFFKYIPNYIYLGHTSPTRELCLISM